ncbi:MAG TPA: HupE/UreJ family protein [Polyangia bacterium]|nr:HupE/UreJ family protein [Polyangia bacterium]
MIAVVAFAAVGGVAPGNAVAHELTPALLSLVERAPDEIDVLWRVPRDEAPRALIAPVMPQDAVSVGGKQVQVDSQAHAERWVLRRTGGVRGAEIRLDGPAAAQTDALVRVVLLDGRVVHGRLSPGGAPFVVPRDPTAATVARIYLRLGTEHILLGWDHLLFVLGLLLLTRTTPSLVKTITAFTAAHSVTLVLATLGVVRVPGPPVEATIALSIVFVAREILVASDHPLAVAVRHPWVVALAFGLLHGLGFAGALAQLGLPRGELPVALATFNVGVELGQLAFVAAIIAPRYLARRLGVGAPRFARSALGYSIGACAVALCLTRIAAFAIR